MKKFLTRASEKGREAMEGSGSGHEVFFFLGGGIGEKFYSEFGFLITN